MKSSFFSFSIILLLLAPPNALYSQENNTNHVTERPWLNFYFNIGADATRTESGASVPYFPLSVNLERVYFIKDNFFLAGGLGLGMEVRNPFAVIYFLDSGSEDPLLLGDRLLLLPHHLTAGFSITDNKNLFIETGLGGSRIFNSADRKYILYPLAGLRYQPLERNRIMFRIYGAFPTSNLKQTGLAFNHLGFSFGWSLAKDPD